MEKLVDFLKSNKISFAEMIRSFNFWAALTSDEKDECLKAYENGELNKIGGWY